MIRDKALSQERKKERADKTDKWWPIYSLFLMLNWLLALIYYLHLETSESDFAPVQCLAAQSVLATHTTELQQFCFFFFFPPLLLIHSTW